MVAGELVFAVRHKSGLVRTHIANELHQVLRGVTFDVELGLRPGLEQHCQFIHIAGTDMAFIRAGVDGDALRPSF